MFMKKLDRSTMLKLSILFVLVFALVVTVIAIANAPLAPSQVAGQPDFSNCATGPQWGSSPANSNSSRFSTPHCPPLVQPQASWGS
jgi:hypothetical protein